MSEVYIGSYKYQQRELQEKRLRKFHELCEKTTVIPRNSRNSGYGFSKTRSEEKYDTAARSHDQIPSDPTTKKLDELLRQTEKLGKDARNYNEEHVNQEFRRINAECFDVQDMLDKIEANEETRKMKKFCILKAERAAQLISSKIHKAPDCKICLPLR